MPNLKIDDTLRMYYESDNFVEPWLAPETILLVHGIGGCTTEWYAWVPLLSHRYAVVRVDLRGWGKSSVPPAGYQWSMDNFASDLKKFMDRLGIQKVHLVGAKLGGRIAIHFASHYPDRLHSLTLVTTPMELRNLGDTREQRPKTAEGKKGVERWARATMKERLGDVAPEMMEWWIKLYSSHSPRVVSEVYDLAWWTDEYRLLSSIRVPTLVIDHNTQSSIEEIKSWQTLIPGSRLAVIPVTHEGRQISASKPAECVSALLEFLDAHFCPP
jgi:3-oxoadipate enol-lactonase